MPRWPSRNEVLVALSFFVVLLFVSWLRRGQKIAVLEQAIAAKPRVEFRDRVVEKRIVVKGPERIVLGPERVVKVMVTAPDGTKTTTTTTEREQKTVDLAGETITANKERELVRTETPVCPPPPRARTRYAGLILGGDGYAGSWVKGARGGINVFESWDLGGNFAREKSGATVLGGDVSFRW